MKLTFNATISPALKLPFPLNIRIAFEIVSSNFQELESNHFNLPQRFDKINPDCFSKQFVNPS